MDVGFKIKYFSTIFDYFLLQHNHRGPLLCSTLPIINPVGNPELEAGAVWMFWCHGARWCREAAIKASRCPVALTKFPSHQLPETPLPYFGVWNLGRVWSVFYNKCLETIIFLRKADDESFQEKAWDWQTSEWLHLGMPFPVIFKCFGSLSNAHGNLKGIYFVLTICEN